MAPKKPVKPTKLQVKANQGNKVLTGPKGSKPQSTTTNRVRTQGGTTMSKPAPSAGRRINPKAAKPKPPAAKPKPPAAKPAAKPNSRALANPREVLPNSGRAGGNLPKAVATVLRERIQGPRASSNPPSTRPTRGGALATQGNAKPENPRRTNARNRQATAGRGTTGPGRVGQPAGSANRMFGANVVNNSVNRAIAATRLASLGKVAGRVAVPVAIASQLADIKGGFEKLANHPFMKKLGKGETAPSAGRRTNPKAAKPSKPAKPTKPKPNMDRPGLRYEKMTDTQAPRSAYGLKDKPSTPKPPAATTPIRASAPSRSSTPSRSSAPASRPAASAPARTPSRPAASRPSTPKPPSAPSAPKVAATSGIGPVKSGAEYARARGSISETTRQLREMRKRSEERQKKAK